MDNGGRFPVHLNELEPDYVPSLADLRCCTIGKDKEPAYFLDWLYFGGSFDDKTPPKLLLASPQATTTRSRQQRVIVEGDISGRIVEEAEYQQLLSETVRQMQVLEQHHRAEKASAQ